MPLLTTRFTFAPPGRCLPAAGLSETTLPFLTVDDVFFSTVPTLQWAFLIARFATTSFFPLTFGTTQTYLVNFAVTELAAVRETVHSPPPEHAPDQPENFAVGPGVAVSVTLVP